VIIFGYGSMTGTKATGTFSCPRCGVMRSYAHKRVRRFFTLYFIPVIPLDTLGEYVQCDSCGGTFYTEVLAPTRALSNEQYMATFGQALKRVMASMMAAGQRCGRQEIETAQEVCHRVLHESWSERDIYDEFQRASSGAEEESGAVQMIVSGSVSVASSGADETARVVHEIAPNLNDQARETLVWAALSVAAADDVVGRPEREFLENIAGWTGMSPAHLQGILAAIDQPGKQ
jgi:tellurite resistance protein